MRRQILLPTPEQIERYSRHNIASVNLCRLSEKERGIILLEDFFEIETVASCWGTGSYINLVSVEYPNVSLPSKREIPRNGLVRTNELTRTSYIDLLAGGQEDEVPIAIEVLMGSRCNCSQRAAYVEPIYSESALDDLLVANFK